MKTGSLSFSPSFPAKIANTSTTSTGWPIFLHIVEVPKGNLRDPTIRITVKFHTLLSPISLPPTRLSFPSFSYIFSRSTILPLSLYHVEFISMKSFSREDFRWNRVGTIARIKRPPPEASYFCSSFAGCVSSLLSFR